jgi:hypothetical protein
MNSRYYCVAREDNTLVFRDRVQDKAVRDFLYALADARERGYQDIVLDFSRCERAYPEGVLPIVCVVDALTSENVGFRALLPEQPSLGRLFLNANWAHFLDPETYAPVNLEDDRHLSARRYTTFEEQQALVNSALLAPR